jgi:hypothetical protein
MIELVEPYEQYEGKWITSTNSTMFLVKHVEHHRTSDKVNHIRYFSITIYSPQTKNNTLGKYWLDDSEYSFSFHEPSNRELYTAIRIIFE